MNHVTYTFMPSTVPSSCVTAQSIPSVARRRGDKAARLGEDVRVLALEDPFAVRGVRKGDARDPVDYCKRRVLREGRVQRPAEKQEVEAEARGGGDKRRKAADDEIYQKLAVLDAQRLYLLYHPYLSSLPQIREMMYLGLPFISS